MNHLQNQRPIRTGVIGAGLFGKALLLQQFKRKRIFLHTLVLSVHSDHNARKFGFEIQATEESAVWESEEIEALLDLLLTIIMLPSLNLQSKPARHYFLKSHYIGEELGKWNNGCLSLLPIIMVGHNRRFFLT